MFVELFVAVLSGTGWDVGCDLLDFPGGCPVEVVVVEARDSFLGFWVWSGRNVIVEMCALDGMGWD